MLKNKTFYCLLLLLFSNFLLFAQEPAKKDTTSVYKNIQKFSEKKKTTNFIHRLVFRPIKPKVNQNNPTFDFIPYQGKKIRFITIVTLDPFGNKIQNTTLTPPENLKKVEKWGNKLHLKSKDYTIRKVLLFKENETLDSISIKESVRIIRSQRFINRVEVRIFNLPELSDTVDIIVTVLDSWSLVPNGSFSSNQTTLKLKERNFLGQGHEIRGEYTNKFNEGEDGHFLQYTIPNFRKTFIKIQATNQESVDNNSFKNFDISRQFFSPLTKWAGGIAYEEHFKQDTLADKNGIYSKQNFNYITNDYWLGHAFALKNNPLDKSKITNIILAARFANVKFTETPLVAYDTINFYSNEKVLLLSVGLNARKFIQERYLFNNGIIEDVPIGKAYSLTTGYQRKNHKDQLYLGARASFGNFYRWGFFSMNAEWGTFFRDSKTSQTTFSFQTNYFTKLYELGDWKIRQFLKQQVILGANRLASTGDQITINGENGILGFNNALYGTKKLVFSAQTQSYSPWNFWGFRLNPFFNYAIAVIGSPKSSHQKNRTFSSIGLGVIINNDYLVFSSFQLSFAYYPNTFNPNDKNVITNAFETSDFGLLDFELNKPKTVLYK